MIGIVGIALPVLFSSFGWAADAASQSTGKSGKELLKGLDCLSCHAVDHQVVGPAFDAVAKRYAGQKGAEQQLVNKIRNGGAGNWGQVAMPPHPNVSEQRLSRIVQWILSLKPETAQASKGQAKQYQYTNSQGKSVTTDFPVFTQRNGSQEVTKEVFHGYALYNSYCFRCHGPDASGGEYAPDLRRSLNQGMSKEQFLSVAMTGREAKGMPSWAGFFSPQEIDSIYQYVKARSLDLVPAGRPNFSGDMGNL